MLPVNALEADLKTKQTKREAIRPTPITFPEDLPAHYRAHIDDLVATLSDEDVSGRASDELHELVDTDVVTRDAEAKLHELELRGKLLELLSFADSKKAATLSGAACPFGLVAGVGFEPTTFRL